MHTLKALLCATALSALTSAHAAMVHVYDDSIQAGQNVVWTASNTYILHGKVFIEQGARLHIPAGTRVLADGAAGAAATVLVVCRGGQLFAEGTQSNPVVFTSVLDTLAVPLPISNLARGLWGGIQICGRAPNNLPGGVGDLSSDITVADIARVRFGDSTSADPNDNSGILRHVSIRHAGILDISEVKSLVLASVGRSTVIDYVEVFQGLEDGFYMMGGTVDLKHCISAFQAGDCFYYESGYQGRGQFLFGIQTVIPGGSKNGCMAKLESDDFGNTPLSTGAWYNMTLVGTGVSNPDTWKYKYGLYYKANGAGSFVNSILTQCSNYGVYVEDLGAGNELISSMARLNAGELAIHNNILHGFGKGNTIDSIAMGNAALQTYLTDGARKNDLADPLLGGLGWDRTGALDPRPSATGPATQNVATVPADGFFEQTTYRGAFSPDGSVWAAGWSTLATTGVFKPQTVSLRPGRSAVPTNGRRFGIWVGSSAVTARWSSSQAQASSIDLLAPNGRLIRTLWSGSLASGEHMRTCAIGAVPPGAYIVRLSAGTATTAATVVTR